MADYTVPYNTSSATGRPTPSPDASVTTGWRTDRAMTGGSTTTPTNRTGGWGSFGTKDNWQQAFFSAHGRPPGAQDEADYWDSQLFAAVAGRAPTRSEWQNRYWTSQWDNNQRMYVTDNYGNRYPVPANDGMPRTPALEGFIRFGVEGDEPPEIQRLVQQIQDWARSTGSEAPGWLQEARTPVVKQMATTPASTQEATPASTQTATPETVQPAKAPAEVTPQLGSVPSSGLGGSGGFGGNAPMLNTSGNPQPGYSGARDYSGWGSRMKTPTTASWTNPQTWIEAARNVYGANPSIPDLVRQGAEGWGAVLGRK